MKKTLLLVAIATVCATALSFGVARWLACRTQAPAVASIQDPAWLRRELHLTAAQAREVEKSETAFRAQLDSLCTAHCAARMGLGDEIAKAQPDPAKAAAWVERMNAVQAAAERATLTHILQVRALLDQPQAQRYSALIHDQVCSMPMGAP